MVDFVCGVGNGPSTHGGTDLMTARQALARINAQLKADMPRIERESTARFHRTNDDAKTTLAEINRKLAARRGNGR